MKQRNREKQPEKKTDRDEEGETEWDGGEGRGGCGGWVGWVFLANTTL